MVNSWKISVAIANATYISNLLYNTTFSVMDAYVLRLLVLPVMGSISDAIQGIRCHCLI